VRPPALRVLRGEAAVEMIGSRRPDVIESVGDDAKGHSPAQIHQSGDRCPRRRSVRLKRELMLRLVQGGGRQRVEKGEVGRKLVSFRREMSATQPVEQGKVG